ncbi:MAG: pilus assembly protein N-terminal domain-containing protein [Acidobacteria bacterium]|nr:pilus assembly protein N-terminal domain-containing protein [Acidobacteriota bacterium]MBI3282184.1 pilus assembly protein N-terminal domain-containing protein [Acidobacteriota bacterium]
MIASLRPLSACLLLVAALSSAAAQNTPPRELTLTAGKGELLQFDNDIQRVVVSEPKIADAVVVSPREVMVNGKGAGKTTLVVWEAGSPPARWNINVTADTSDLEDFRHAVRAGFPGADITVTGSGDTIALTGTVANEEQAKRAAAMAQTRARNVVNLLQSPPRPDPRQILLQVKFASIDRVALSELGFNYFSTNDKAFGALSTQQFSTPRFTQLQFQDGEVRTPGANFSDLLNLFVFRPDLNIGATIRALQGRNLLQILAEPNLIAIEGAEASFLAGGEFPFPTLTATTTGGAVAPVVTVQFKRFGIQLGFQPTLTSNGTIHLKVTPEVSSLDFGNAVTLQGFLIPAIATRRAETQVILKDGESFAIAGLIDNRVVEVLNRVKGLGDIPIIGHLFRSRSARKSTDELLVVITPRFVRPLAPEENVPGLTFPDEFLPPAAEEKAAQDAKKNRKQKGKEPAFVGPRGHQEPK